MLFRILFTLLTSAFGLLSFASPGSSENRIYLPKGGHCLEYAHHAYYSLCYSQEHRQARWIIHKLTSESISGPAKRKSKFRPDPMVKNPVKGKDYKRSGYDRGHMVPAGDMKLNRVSMGETFYMSNISPQNRKFNQGLWRVLEEQIRQWVLDNGPAYVVTAPVLESGLPTIKAGVSIPEFYYKILYFPKQKFMRAFMMPNKNLDSHKLKEFLVKVDDIEKVTGFDFFSELPDSLEKKLESEIR